MVSKEGKRIIRDGRKIMDEAADIKGLGAVLDKIINAILARLASMGTNSEGVANDSKSNTHKLRMIEKDIEGVLKDEYAPKIQDYYRSFIEVENNAVALSLEINDLKVGRGMFRDIRQNSLNYVENALLGDGVKARFIDDWMVNISRQVISGGDLFSLESTVRNFVINGRFESYVRQIAMDTINQYHGALQNKIKAEFELEWIVYVGSIISTSRDQCIRWVGKQYLHESELEGEIAWANDNGSGMIRGTNKGNFAINRGGWSCRHEGIWVSDEVVPKAIRNRIKQAA